MPLGRVIVDSLYQINMRNTTRSLYCTALRFEECVCCGTRFFLTPHPLVYWRPQRAFEELKKNKWIGNFRKFFGDTVLQESCHEKLYVCIQKKSCKSENIMMFNVMSPFVNINVPTRDLLVPYAKQSFQIMVGILALQLLQCL